MADREMVYIIIEIFAFIYAHVSALSIPVTEFIADTCALIEILKT